MACTRQFLVALRKWIHQVARPVKRRRFIADITGFGPSISPYRQQVIQTTADDIQAAAQLLDMSTFRRAVLTSTDMAKKDGLTTIDVNSLR